MNEHLMRAVIEAAAFFGLADDDTVDPDAAVEQLEQLAYYLKKLSPDEQHEFVRFIERLAEEEPREERERFLRSLPENVGLAAE